MVFATKIKQYAFLGLLILIAIIFSYFWLKAEQPVISKISIQTENEIYSARFGLKSLVDYEIIFKDKPLYLNTRVLFGLKNLTDYDIKSPYLKTIYYHKMELPNNIELPFSLNLPDPLYYEISMVLQSDGDENGFIIKPKYTSNLHASKYGMLIALIAVLLLFALQWNKYLFASGNKISAIILSLLFCFVFQHFCRMLLYELSGAFNAWDANIYWTIGRGIVNGISPYTGLFENKPPGIFILSALSFYFFDSPILTHITQVLVLLIIAIIPLLAYVLHSKEKSIFALAFSTMLGLLLSLYSHERSGLVQVESFGAAFGALAVLLMLSSFEKCKILKILGISLCMLISCGFKEPLLFPILGTSFILCKNIKDWALKFVLPLFIALCLGVIALFSLGWLDEYLLYLFYMASTHVNAVGSSPLERVIYFWILFGDQNLYSLGFGYLFACIFCALLWISRTKPLQILSLVAALFLVSLSVALSGEYFAHHFIFVVPFYAAILIKYNTNSKNKINALLLVLLTLSILNLPDINWEKRSQNFNLIKTTAISVPITKYLDSVMEQSDVKRFVNLCGNTSATVFNCYSSEIGKHSPQGPYFIMDIRFFDRIPNYADSVLNYVRNGQIAIYADLGGITPIEFQKELNAILEELYTPIPWKEIELIPKPEGVPPERILFRKRGK